MSITPALKASARSAYRNLYRVSSKVFAGDDIVLPAFRMKMRKDAEEARGIVDVEAFQQQIKLSWEIADVLKRNVVQAVKVSPPDVDSTQATWRVRITKDTELGDNDSIKSPPPIEPSSRRMRKGEKSSQPITPDAVLRDTGYTHPSKTPTPILYYSALKKAHKQRTIPELREEDLEESFVRGSGPGGQSINKTENNVQLLHKPTGLRVSCQETRSLTQNRKLARRLLLQKLDMMANPGLSKEEMARAKQRERERRRRKKAKKKTLEKAESASDD